MTDLKLGSGEDGEFSPEVLAQMPIDRSILEGMSGAQKAVIFLVSLDERVATKVISHLSDYEVRQLRESSVGLKEAPATAIQAVHQEFLQLVSDGVPASLKGSSAYLRRLAGNALGEGRASELWSDNPTHDAGSALAHLETGVLEALLESEQPRTVAVVLSLIPAAKAAELVQRMEPARRQDVIFRLSQLESVPERVLREIEKSFNEHAVAFSRVRRAEIAGQQTAANIIKRLPNEINEELLEGLRDIDAETAAEIEKSLFTIEDLVRIDSRGMQQLLKEIQTDQLVLALKTASDELKEKVFGNISRRAADILNEELELLGPVRLRDVEEAQQGIVRTALELEAEGRIAIAREGSDDYV